MAAEDIAGLNGLKNASFLYNFAAPDGEDMPDTMARIAPHFHKTAGTDARPIAAAGRHITTEAGQKILFV